MDPKKAADDLVKLTANPTPSLSKEIEHFEASSHMKSGEVEVVEEVAATPEVEKSLETEGYIEKIEKEIELVKPVVDDYTKQVLLASVAPQNPKVKLPLDDEGIKKGLHHKVWESFRWLAEWCWRQVKMVS